MLGKMFRVVFPPVASDTIRDGDDGLLGHGPRRDLHRTRRPPSSRYTSRVPYLLPVRLIMCSAVVTGNLRFEPDGEKSKLAAESVEAATIAAELIGAPSVDELVTALTSKKIYVANTAMQTYLDTAKVGSGLHRCMHLSYDAYAPTMSLILDMYLNCRFTCHLVWERRQWTLGTVSSRTFTLRCLIGSCP